MLNETKNEGRTEFYLHVNVRDIERAFSFTFGHNSPIFIGQFEIMAQSENCWLTVENCWLMCSIKLVHLFWLCA